MTIDGPARPAPVAAAAPRMLARRTGLPTGRAVFGALLVIVAAVGTFALATGRDDGPHTRYAVLVREVSPGARLKSSDLELRTMVLDEGVRARAFTDIDSLVGAVALTPLAEDVLVQSSQIVPAPRAGDADIATTHEFSLPVPRDRTPPALHRGEGVTVLATYGSGSEASTLVTVHNAIVLAYDTDSDTVGGRDSGRLTLAMSDPNALMATAHAAQVADITIVRSTRAEEKLPDRYQHTVERAKVTNTRDAR